MPKDKSASHKRIKEAMKAEFLAKGFIGASIRSIGEKAGMTSAALYRHYSSKEEMFCSLVEPFIEKLRKSMNLHQMTKYELADKQKADFSLGGTFTDIVRDVILPNRDEFLLLINCSEGTKYENFLHSFAEENRQELEDAVKFMKKHGYPAKDLEKEELHMLLSAYLTAAFEPIIYGYSDEKVIKYLECVNEFFTPGWMRIMGLC